MTMFLLLGAGIAFFLNAYNVSLIFIGISILETALVMLRATVDPDWLVQRRINAGVWVDVVRPGKHLLSLIVTKVLLLWVLGFFAYQVAAAAGYH